MDLFLGQIYFSMVYVRLPESEEPIRWLLRVH